MVLSEVKNALEKVDEVTFVLPNGKRVPQHFHVTEVGHIEKHFIDCGGTERKDAVINFQLWTAQDYDHRLSAKKLNSIIDLSKSRLNLDDLDVEVEYQGDTIGKYGLAFDGKVFWLTAKQTDCLAKDNCGIPQEQLKQDTNEANACAPGSGCC